MNKKTNKRIISSVESTYNVIQFDNKIVSNNGNIIRRKLLTYSMHQGDIHHCVATYEHFHSDNTLISSTSDTYDKHGKGLETIQMMYNDGHLLAHWYTNHISKTAYKVAYYPSGIVRAECIELGHCTIVHRWNEDGTFNSDRFSSCSS